MSVVGSWVCVWPYKERSVFIYHDKKKSLRCQYIPYCLYSILCLLPLCYSTPECTIYSQILHMINSFVNYWISEGVKNAAYILVFVILQLYHIAFLYYLAAASENFGYEFQKLITPLAMLVQHILWLIAFIIQCGSIITIMFIIPLTAMVWTVNFNFNALFQSNRSACYQLLESSHFQHRSRWYCQCY